ncbi:hypothetical protein D3C86_896500 [compost metagenome]
MTITPLPEKAPHMDAAAASLRTVIVSISFGFRFATSPSYGKLSTTTKGLVFPKMVLLPRTLKGASFDPTGIRLLGIRKPGVIPSKRLRTSAEIRSSSCVLVTVENDPVTLSFGISW